MAVALVACGNGDEDTTPDARSGGGGEGEPDADQGANGNGGGDGVDRAAYVSELTIPEIVDDEPVCCRNFGEISDDPDAIDNAVADLADSFSLFLDIQAEITEAIEDGSIALLLHHRDLAGEDDTFDLEILFADFAADTEYEDAEGGEGTFEISEVSYDDGGSPQVVFEDAELAGAALTTDPSEISVVAPVGEDALAISVQESELSGNASVTEDDIAYDSGELSGYVSLDLLFEEMNTLLLSDECDCLGAEEDIYVGGDGDWDSNCIGEDDHQCEDDSLCATLGADGQVCTLGPSLATGAADLDTDDSGNEDAISIGFEWSAAPAEIVE